jgi:hypothetical protein
MAFASSNSSSKASAAPWSRRSSWQAACSPLFPGTPRSKGCACISRSGSRCSRPSELQTALVLVAWLIGFSSSATRLCRRRAAAHRRLRRYSHRLDRLFLHQPLHLVQRARAPRHHRAQALRRAERFRRPDRQTADRGHRRTAEARAGASGDDRSRKDARPDFARPGRRSVSREHPRRRRARSADLRENYKEGAGAGVRYSAFDRYTKLAQQSLGAHAALPNGTGRLCFKHQAARFHRKATASLPAGL